MLKNFYIYQSPCANQSHDTVFPKSTFLRKSLFSPLINESYSDADKNTINHILR